MWGIWEVMSECFDELEADDVLPQTEVIDARVLQDDCRSFPAHTKLISTLTVGVSIGF